MTNKSRMRVFLKKLDRLCAEHDANIVGQIAFFDTEKDKWGDWLALRVQGEELSSIRPDEDGDADIEGEIESLKQMVGKIEDDINRLVESVNQPLRGINENP